MTVRNFDEIKKVRSSLNESLGENMKLFGILSKDEIFFMIDIFLDTYNFVQNSDSL